MPQSVQQVPWRLATCLALALSFGCSTTVTLDLRNVVEPVMLNILPPVDSDWTVSEEGKVIGTVLIDDDFFSWNGSSWSQVIRENDAEKKLKAKLAGHPSRVVSGVRIEVAGLGLNMWPLLSTGRTSIRFFGEVVDLAPAADEQELD